MVLQTAHRKEVPMSFRSIFGFGFGRCRSTQSGATPARRLRAALSVEPLEDRIVPSFTEPASMTELAKNLYSSPPSLPARLYLNFDGAAPYVLPFTQSGQKTEADIQEILFRTAEVFAPFNVVVSRVEGDGQFVAFTGATTIFVGDHLYKSGPHAWTSQEFVDYPGLEKGTSHVPNSDGHDIAHVDPFGDFKFDPDTGEII